MMAEVCLTFLNSRPVRALIPNLLRVSEITKFLEYATCFWGIHAVGRLTEPVKSLALQLLDGYENHVSAAVLRGREHFLQRRDLPNSGRDLVGDVQGISGLHCIAFWGIEGIAISMLEMKRWQVNGCDSRGETPLMWAIKYRKSKMVELFLKSEGIEPDTVSGAGRTALSLAAGLRDENAVKLLLGRGDVNPDSRDRDDRTPLSFAASGGHEGVVKLLLQCGDVNPNSSDRHGRTPLSIAASQGYECVVKLLLDHGDVKPDSPDGNGRTPLSFAASEGHEGVAQLLLERGGVNPNPWIAMVEHPYPSLPRRDMKG